MDVGIETAVTYGNPDEGYAICLRDYREIGPNRFKAEVWRDGDIIDQVYAPNLSDCHDWLERLKTPFGNDFGKTIGLAPQSVDLGKTVTWVLIDEGRADESWWEGGDDWATPEQRAFLRFRNMAPL